MLSIEFMKYLLDDFYIYFAILVCYTCGYFYLVRKYIYTILDPLFLYTLYSCFGGTIVVFMFYKDVISLQYFLSYLFTQAAFVLGFRVFRPLNLLKIRPSASNCSKNRSTNTFIPRLYIVSSLVYIISQIVSYSVGGIPLLYKSRLDFYISDSGFGVISRIIYVTALVTIFLLIHRFNNWKGNIFLRLYDVFVLFNVITNSVLSGSKSSFLTLLSVVFYYSIFSLRMNGRAEFFYKIKKYQYLMLSFAVVVAISVALIQDMGQYGEKVGLIAFVNRLVLSGDVYVNAYPYAVIEYMQWHNPFLVIFQDFIGLFRIVSWENLPTTLGIELFRYLVPESDTVGPNPRHNVFGLVYFGFYGSILFSFGIGFVLSFVRNRLYFLCSPTIFSGLIYMLVSLPIMGIESDIGSVVGNLDSTLLVLLPLIIVVYIFDKGSKPMVAKGLPGSLAQHHV